MASTYPDDDQDDLPPVSIEDRARAMGWKPQHEYRGDSRRWTDAAEFIAHGEAELPILRDQNRRLSEKVARFETTVAEQSTAIEAAMTLARRADETGYQRGLKELKAKQREAVETGDTATFDQISEQIDAAERERASDPTHVTVPIRKEPPMTERAPPAPTAQDPETATFIADNPWFNQRAILRNAMIAAHSALVAAEGKQTGIALADQYERAKADVAESFPHFFPSGEQDDSAPTPIPAVAPRPRLRAPALSPSSGPHRTTNATPFDRIPAAERAEAIAAFNNIAKYDPDATAEEYVKLYLGEEEDVLALRTQRKKG